MPIETSFTDKESKKLKRISLVYIIIIAALVISPFLFKLKPKSNTNEKKTPKQTQYLCIVSDLEQKYTDYLTTYAKDNNYEILDGENTKCTISIARNITSINEYYKLLETVYVMAGRMDTKTSSLTSEQLKTFLTRQKISDQSVIWDEDTDNFIRSKYKDIGVGQKVYEKGERQVKTLTSIYTLSIMPFEELDNRYKVISIEGNNPLEKDFNTNRYPLVDKYWIKGEQSEREKLITDLNDKLKPFTYNPSKLATILLTGSSDIGSGIQQGLISKNGNSYIAPELQDLIQNSDIAQLNNEASISTPCIQIEKTSRHCTTSTDISQIKELGFDVVGVNGNHIMDVSYQTYLDTLNWYNKNKILYYGGGVNSSDAWKPRVIEKNGTKFAFIGFNFLYPFSYYSTRDTAGSANIDMSIMKSSIEEAKRLADVVIVDMGWGYEYDSKLVDYQIEYATKALSYGADIVMGTNPKVFQKQSHTLHKTILYGMGAFLPQSYVNTNPAIYQLTFYNGKYIAFKTIPLIYSNSKLSVALDNQSGKIYDRVYKDLEIK